MMSKVYVAQENPKHSYQAAACYGEVVIVTTKEYAINKDTNKGIHEDIAKVVKEFNPNRDYLLISGDSMVFAILFASIMLKHLSCKVLKYSNLHEKYKEIKLSVDELIIDA